MRMISVVAVLLIASGSVTWAQTERREVGAHVHGAGTLSIAIEGSKISMDLSAPANDILGFEHQPTTPQQTLTLATAKEVLANPLAVIEFPVAAGCTIESANVAFNAAAPADASKPEKNSAEPSGHADFDVDYVLTCKAVDKITALTFPYFKQFLGAQKLTVTLATDKGQSQYDVTRENPSLTLK